MLKPSDPPTRWRRLAGITAGVLALHLLVLALTWTGLGERWRVSRWQPPPVQTWTVTTPSTTPAKPTVARATNATRAVAPAPALTDGTPSTFTPVPVASASTTPPSAEPPPLPAAEANPGSALQGDGSPSPQAPRGLEPDSLRVAQGPVDGPVQTPSPVQGDASATPPSPPLKPSGDAAAPESPPEPNPDASPALYRAQLPPPFQWHYALRRGALSGSAELRFERQGSDYLLDLRGTVVGLEVLGQRSQGASGFHGLEPERFVERRLGRDRMAANFDRAKGQISYSGPTTLKPLLAGAQDRLSWMVQLGAVIAADPERFGPGAVVLMSISGVRADVDTWAFQVQAVERLELPAGVVERALRVFRQPRQPYDTQIEVWLDPQRHHLPVKARMTVLPSRDRLDLVLDP